MPLTLSYTKVGCLFPAMQCSKTPGLHHPIIFDSGANLMVRTASVFGREPSRPWSAPQSWPASESVTFDQASPPD